MLFRERQQVVICVLAGVMVFGFVLFRYLPLRKRIKTAEETRAAQRLAVTKASVEQRQIPKLKEQLLKLQETVADYQANIPVQRQLGMFLQQLTDLMNGLSLTEQLIQPGSQVETQQLNCIPISINCKGSLTQIFEFYKLLQGLDRFVRIEQVELTNDSDFSGQVHSQTKVSIYYRTGA